MGSLTFATIDPADPVTVTITDTLGFSQATATSLADVVGLLTPFGQSVPFVAGTPASVVVAGFTDSSTLAVASEFGATIDWGDGTANSVGIVANSGAGFSVTGSHTYTSAGTDPISVSITDAASGASVEVTGTATVAAPSYSVTAAGETLAATVGVPFYGTVASFSSDDPSATASDFTATISYDNGSMAEGTVVSAPGGFVVTGSLTFATADPADPVMVTITDTLGSSPATANSVADVTNPGGRVDAVRSIRRVRRGGRSTARSSPASPTPTHSRSRANSPP